MKEFIYIPVRMLYPHIDMDGQIAVPLDELVVPEKENQCANDATNTE